VWSTTMLRSIVSGSRNTVLPATPKAREKVETARSTIATIKRTALPLSQPTRSALGYARRLSRVADGELVSLSVLPVHYGEA